MTRIFISYRRDDTAGYAGRLYDRLSQHFGDDNIFMDVDTLELGDDFVEVIKEAVDSSDILVAMIGKQWLTITDDTGQQRLDNPEDFVRLEIKTALKGEDIRVIPALVRGAVMPRSQDLPDDLTELARRHALEISDARFNYDVDRLIEHIEKVLGSPEPASPIPKIKKPSSTPAPAAQPRSTSWLLFGGVAGGLLLVIILGSIIFSALGGGRDEPTPSVAVADNTDTRIPALLLTNTPVSPAPTSTSINTPQPPTDTPISIPTQTDTPEPQTNTPVSSTDTPASVVLDNFITASDGSPMVLIPAGPFTMGSDSGSSNEQPVHEVTLDAFYIDQYEVTNARYVNCVTAGACTLPSCTERYNDPAKADHPVVCVNWGQANTYCKWRKDRLPTEAEWEKAARGTDGRIYPWGDAAPNETLLNYNQNVHDSTPVGSYPDGVSPYGVADMAGNVFEWVADWYDEDYYATAPSHNPQGPDDGEDKVLRGGSWPNPDYYARASGRYGYDPVSLDVDGGFRCVAAPPE